MQQDKIMANNKTKLNILRSNQRSYLNKDFDAFRAELVQYGRTYFSDKISDFSEGGLAGMFVEMTAYVGDVMSFYLDHQFNELDIATAVENDNIERLIKSSGVKIKGAAPASADIDFSLTAPAVLENNDYVPDIRYLPIIRAGTIVSSNSGVKFELGEELNFAKKDLLGNFIATVSTSKTDSAGNPSKFLVKLTGLCMSGITNTETFIIPDEFKAFRTVILSSPDVTQIISIKDSLRNEYFEVEALTQDIVYKRVINVDYDSEFVPENIELIPAPYRFISDTSRNTGLTTIRFGGGSAISTDNDIMPDPSEIAIPLFGNKKTFSRFTLDPNSLLQTSTLGLAPRNTTITILYRAGGGLSHNVAENSITTVTTLLTKFSSAALSSNISATRASITVSNKYPASGGDAQLTLSELKSVVASHKNSQSRIVTKADLIARIYSMPANFGRVFRVGLRDNPNNPLASVISIISRDSAGKLIISPDNLKENLRTYINQYRLISDAIDIVDAKVANIRIEYGVVIDSSSNKGLVIQKINSTLKKYMKIENFQIEQPIITADLVSLIINTSGVLSLVDFKVSNVSGTIDTRVYSNNSFSVASNTDRGIITSDPGSIFELKYPNDDIIGVAR
jgi:hypothetical protein